jgi:D-alanyl-lipoteichoic acid acyltransferase DltB (MBOAT superfamily)
MAFLLEIGEGAFLLQKCIVVGVWLIVLVIHKNFRLARIGLYSLAGVYSLLILGHFALIASDVSPQRQTLEPNSQISNEASDQRGQRRFGPQGTNPQADSL